MGVSYGGTSTISAACPTGFSIDEGLRVLELQEAIVAHIIQIVSLRNLRPRFSVNCFLSGIKRCKSLPFEQEPVLSPVDAFASIIPIQLIVL